MQSKWVDIEKSASVRFLKLAIEDAKLKVLDWTKLVEEETKKFLDIVNVKYWVDLLENLDSVGQKTQNKIHLQNLHKLHWLRSKRSPINKRNLEILEVPYTNKTTKNRRFRKKQSSID